MREEPFEIEMETVREGRFILTILVPLVLLVTGIILAFLPMGDAP